MNLVGLFLYLREEMIFQALVIVLSFALSKAISLTDQHVLGNKDDDLLASRNTYTKREQGDDLCVAGGRQWTGKVPVSHGNSLFYWYFESQVLPERAPLLMFLTGGPGEACTVPLLSGVGPCIINEHGNGTTYNEWTWTTEFNVLFVDEIAGSGFSKSHQGIEYQPSTVQEVASDLKLFLKTFVDDAFPELKGRSLHVMGESFGGFLAPVVTALLANKTDTATGSHPDLKVDSLIATSTILDMGFWAPSYYDTLCGPPVKYLNASECGVMGSAVPECEKAMLECRRVVNEEACVAAAEACALLVQFWMPPEHNIVRLDAPCHSFPTCSSEVDKIVDYLNSPRVQAILGFAEEEEEEGKGGKIELIGVDMGINRAFDKGKSMYFPLMDIYIYLLEQTDVQILVQGGVLDPDTPVTGMNRALDSMHWYGQAPFRAAEVQDWYYPSKGKQVNGGHLRGYDKLWWVVYDNAGHTVPSDVPEASSFVMKQWVKGRLPASFPRGQPVG
ncbi:Alpha/Beta hydrolase protein [Aspergillus pseudoustus]|uniref:carboxypeptidase C n=1 Tax=Aspergillus pseudoustus TaxID=1810923 RepID=A0ABR4KEH0_9EURO